MRRNTLATNDSKNSDFPLFSQKSTAESRRQLKVEKQFAVVSTDSQESSQQQGLIATFSG
jgi:hypothetical protein